MGVRRSRNGGAEDETVGVLWMSCRHVIVGLWVGQNEVRVRVGEERGTSDLVVARESGRSKKNGTLYLALVDCE